MPNNTLVSIIVPVYKVEKYLDECIESLVNQTWSNIEIILIDDGSPDNCPTMCDTWAEKDHRVKVIHKENGGLSAARNAGIKTASGKWLLFIDSDDVVSHDFVRHLIEVSSRDDIVAVSSVVRFAEELLQHQTVPVVKRCNKELANVRGGMYACGILYSRELIASIGLQFDTTLRNIEDVVWNGIYLRYIAEVIYVDVPYFYRMNPTSITSKCGDYKWQIASWIAARRSMMNWFADKPLTAAQRKEVAGMFRHCQNNIHAECVAGNVSYNDLRAMEYEQSAQFNKSFVSAPERFVINHFPKLYYGIYTLLLRVKNAIRK